MTRTSPPPPASDLSIAAWIVWHGASALVHGPASPAPGVEVPTKVSTADADAGAASPMAKPVEIRAAFPSQRTAPLSVHDGGQGIRVSQSALTVSKASAVAMSASVRQLAMSVGPAPRLLISSLPACPSWVSELPLPASVSPLAPPIRV